MSLLQGPSDHVANCSSYYSARQLTGICSWVRAGSENQGALWPGLPLQGGRFMNSSLWVSPQAPEVSYGLSWEQASENSMEGGFPMVPKCLEAWQLLGFRQKQRSGSKGKSGAAKSLFPPLTTCTQTSLWEVWWHFVKTLGGIYLNYTFSLH